MANLDLWNKIIEHLNGSCESLYQTLEYYKAEALEDDLDFLGYLDDQIFNCTCCGWWFPISEVTTDETQDELACNSCYPEED